MTSYGTGLSSSLFNVKASTNDKLPELNWSACPNSKGSSFVLLPVYTSGALLPQDHVVDAGVQERIMGITYAGPRQ